MKNKIRQLMWVLFLLGFPVFVSAQEIPSDIIAPKLQKHTHTLPPLPGPLPRGERENAFNGPLPRGERENAFNGPLPQEERANALNELIAELLQNNLELKALVQKIEAYEHRIPQASSLEDPRLSFEASNLPLGGIALDRTPMTGLQIYLRQQLPFPGKLKLKKRIAKNQWQQEQQVYLEKLNQLVAKFKQAYFEYAYTSEAISLLKRSQARLQAMAKLLANRYSADEASWQEMINTKVEAAQVENRLLALKAKKKIQQQRILSWLNRSGEALLPLPRLPKALPYNRFNRELILNLAKQNRPWIRRAEQQIKEAQLKHGLAKKSLLPDFDFSVGYRVRDASPGGPVPGEDFFSTGMMLNIPLYGAKKQKNQIREALHLRQKRVYEKQATLQELRFQVNQTLAELKQLRQQVQVSRRKILPQARAALDSTQASFEADQLEFVSVLMSEVNWLNHQIQERRYFYSYHQKLAQLEMDTGVPIHLLEKENE